MAKFVLNRADVQVGSSDISDHVMSVTVDVSSELQETTAMQSNWRTRIGGLKDWSVTLECQQDFAASQLNSIFWPLLGTSVALQIRDNDGGSYTQYAGNAILETYPTLGNAVGELATVSVTFQGNGELTQTVV